ncbi:MAG: DNA gyrase C-terminal beta-propeller domain-containing protein [Gemmataceae bacterium]
MAPFRTASTKVGRRYVRLAEGDRVMMVAVVTNEPGLMLVSAGGHLIHFPLEEVNILSGVGKGVMGIKLDDGDTCLGGLVVGHKYDTLIVEASDGKPMEYRASRAEQVSRGGKGHEVVKRKSFVRVVPPPIQLADWDAVEEREKGSGGNPPRKDDSQKTLFE